MHEQLDEHLDLALLFEDEVHGQHQDSDQQQQQQQQQGEQQADQLQGQQLPLDAFLLEGAAAKIYCQEILYP